MKKFSIFLKRHKRSMLSDKTLTIELYNWEFDGQEIYIKPVAMLRVHCMHSAQKTMRVAIDMTKERSYEEAAKKGVTKIKEALSRALNRRTTCWAACGGSTPVRGRSERLGSESREGKGAVNATGWRGGRVYGYADKGWPPRVTNF